jgi:hypothetical protein
LRTGIAAVIIVILALTTAMGFRVLRVTRAAKAIPIYPGAQEAGGRTRYLPRVLSWDDRSSARVERVFALPDTTPVATIARHANVALAQQGWYLVTPEELQRIANPQVVVWQREPDERLDLMKLWPDPNMTADQRLYGGIFPAQFLDAPLVVEWSWALGGPRSTRSAPVQRLEVRTPPPPRPRND